MSSLESPSDRTQKLWVESSSLAETSNGEEAFTLLGRDCSTSGTSPGSNASQSHMEFAPKEVEVFKDALNVGQDYLGYSLDRWLDQGLREDPWNLMSGLRADSKIRHGSQSSTSCLAFSEPCEHLAACTPPQSHRQFIRYGSRSGPGLNLWLPAETHIASETHAEEMLLNWSNAATASGSPVDNDNSFNATKTMLVNQTSNLSKDSNAAGTNRENIPGDTAKESCAGRSDRENSSTLS